MTNDAETCSHCGASLVISPPDTTGSRQQTVLELSPYSPFRTADGVLNIFGTEVPVEQDSPVTPPPTSSGYLVVHHDSDDWGSSTERIVPLAGREVTIGRSPGCSISLEQDFLASRHHAIIRPVGADHMLIDLGSINGTLVNNEPITHEYRLCEGDVIRIGECEIIYSMGSPPAGAEYGVWANSAINQVQTAEGAGADTNPGFPQSLREIPTQPPSFAPEVVSRQHQDGSSDRSLPAESLPQPVATGQDQSTSETPAPDLDLIQRQVANMVEQLRRQAEAEAREVARLKAEIAALQTTLAAVLKAERQAEDEGPNLAVLIQMTERTVASPRHLDNVIEFAGHVTEIDAALRALKEMRSDSGFIAVVDSVRARLEALG